MSLEITYNTSYINLCYLPSQHFDLDILQHVLTKILSMTISQGLMYLFSYSIKILILILDPMNSSSVIILGNALYNTCGYSLGKFFT